MFTLQEPSLDFGVNPFITDTENAEFTPSFMNDIDKRSDLGSMDTEFCADGNDDLNKTHDSSLLDSSSSRDPSSQSSQEHSASPSFMTQEATQISNVAQEPPAEATIVNEETSINMKMWDSLRAVGNSLALISEEMKVLQKKTDMTISNQKVLHVRSLELDNEIQRSKIYSKNRFYEMIKDQADREYEKSNLVIYNLPIKDWKNCLQKYGNDPKRAAFQYGLYFINYFWKGYNPIDLRATKLSQKDKNNDSTDNDPNRWRLLLKLATPGDAIRLRKRCLRKGFYTIRPGLSPAERNAATHVEQKVQELNGLKDPDDDTIYVRKYLFSIAEVSKKDPKKVIRLYDWQKETDFFESKVSPCNLIEIKSSLGPSKPSEPSNEQTPLGGTSSSHTSLNRAQLPPAPISPFRPAGTPIEPQAPSRPISRPSEPGKSGKSFANLPSQLAPIFNKETPLTPNTRGIFGSSTKVQRKLDLSKVNEPTFMRPAQKRKTTPPKAQPKRKKLPQLTEAERIRRNEINAEKRKKKREEEKAMKQKLADTDAKLMAVLKAGRRTREKQTIRKQDLI